MEAAEAAKLRVEVAYSPEAGAIDLTLVSLEQGASLLDAVHASRVLARFPTLDPARLRCGIWGQLRDPQTRLCDGDRVEVYRPLKVEPMEARRRRHKAQAKQRAALAAAAEGR